MSQALDAMTEDQVLEFAGTCAETARRAEVDLLRAAYQWAVLHSANRLDPAETVKPGREQARRYGGPGTPEVTEFAAAGLGARIGRSPYAARELIADALDLHHRHPQLWARVQAGEVRASYARHVCAKTRDLAHDQAAYVDAGVAESADGRICWTRFEALVEARVAQADPEAAREKEQKAAKARFARRLHGEAHGMASFLVRADLATITTLEAVTTTGAHHLKHAYPDATDDERRVLTVLLLMTGQGLPDTENDGEQDDKQDQAPVAPEVPDLADLLPTVTLFVHLYGGVDSEGIARVEGHGPVTEAWVREVLGPNVRFRIQPVLDLAGQAPVDAYEIPDRHRQAVHLMTPADTFPHAACTSRAMQVDHTIPFDAGGPSGIGNYGPMTTLHHRIKTHAPGWKVRQSFPGIYLWRDPHGAHYLVDHTGTRRIPRYPANGSRLEAEFTNLLLEFDLAA
ncbi:DUF222 domain-containing protein [Nocardioides sp. YIM 152315]|uniref:DUF222 domain-containing protein n=1 Tax=Nocardioides sp. YIM 152315 TaxID=3031760 RepID=UPI0023D9FFDE|nr:DUF222 domain-containing protein [Nocardioides sp. YIM 152315]MDF1604209.1 DUF222 domain-containing protein [Nocardioides sp. YIM 152315]